MILITVASRKGGSGKSTICAHLGVLGSEPDNPAVLVDLDQQHSLGDWWRQRQDKFPLMVEAEAANLPAIVRSARAERASYLFIDCPPHAETEIAAAMRVADLVLIPCRPSAFDLWAARATLEMTEALKKPAMVVLNACPAARTFQFRQENPAVREARAVLDQLWVHVATTTLGDRLTFRSAIISGQAAHELEPGGKAASEVAALWQEIMDLFMGAEYEQKAIAS